MRATFTDEQEALAQAARDLAKSGREAARSALEGDEIPAEPTATLFAGYAGLAVPESDGGAGGGLVDLAIVLEALGRSVSPTPWVAHVLAIQVAWAAGVDVSDAAAGARRFALAVDDAGPEAASVEAGRLRGHTLAVRDGADADAAVVVCADDAVAVAGPSSSQPREALDPTRPLADLAFDDVEVEAVGSGHGGLLRATAAAAAELVGVGRGAVDLATSYARVREQFGQPIGRFQGVAHQLADAWTSVELAWSLALYAAWAVDDATPDAARAVHAAKSAAGEAAIHAAERCTQVHGGIGMTWEADPHLYLRRAVSTDGWLGTARHHRRLLGDDVVATRR